MNTQYAPTTDYPTPTTVVTVPTTSYNALPETGTDSHPQVFLGVVLIVFGVIAVLMSRRNPRR